MKFIKNFSIKGGKERQIPEYIFITLSIFFALYLYHSTFELYLSTNPIYFTVSKHLSLYSDLNSPWFYDKQLSINNLGVTHYIYSVLFRIVPSHILKLWEAVPFLLITTSLILQYLLASKVLNSIVLRILFPLASLFYLEPWWIYQTQSPRFFGFFIIGTVLTIVLINKSFLDLTKKNIFLLSLLWSILFYTHKLLALQYILMFFIYTALCITRENYKIIVKKKIFFYFICTMLSFPLVFLTIRELLVNKLTNPYYGNYQIWTTNFFDIITLANFNMLYFYGGNFVKFTTLAALILGIFLRKNLLLKSASIVIIFSIFTPIGILISKLITPGVLIETFIAGSAFPVLLLIFYFFDKIHIREKINYLVQTCVVLFLFYTPIIKFYKFASNNHKNAKPEVLKENLKKDILNIKGITILSDHKTSTYIPMISDKMVLIADRLNILETPQNNLKQFNKFFTTDFKYLDLIDLKNIFYCENIVLIKKTINNLHKSSMDDNFFLRYGLKYPETYETLLVKYKKISEKNSNIQVIVKNDYSLVKID